MEFVETKILSAQQLEELKLLWNNEYPEKLYIDKMFHFKEYLHTKENIEHILVLNTSGELIGWFFTFIRSEENWFALILASTIQKQGLGRKLLNMAKKKHLELNGWVIDHNNETLRSGEAYMSPLQFYKNNDFEVFNYCRLGLEKISAVKVVWKAQELYN